MVGPITGGYLVRDFNQSILYATFFNFLAVVYITKIPDAPTPATMAALKNPHIVPGNDTLQQ